MGESISKTIPDDYVYWRMKWGRGNPDKPPTELIFDDGQALARLLAEEVVFLNRHWPEKDWPERAQKTTSLIVNCSDVFAWGFSDAEALDHSEIQSLYDMWQADREWGAARWCAIKRNQRPIELVVTAMKEAGVWDARMEALGNSRQQLTGE